MSEEVYVLSARRTPTGSFQGMLSDYSTVQLGSASIRQVLLDTRTSRVDRVMLGCVLPAGLGQAPHRQAALAADLPLDTPCTSISKVCGSGMEAVILAACAIRAKHIETAIAGGMESMTNSPLLIKRAIKSGHSVVKDHMMYDGLENAYADRLSMGAIADKTAAEKKISRSEQDQFATQSAQRAIDAIKSGCFDEEIVPLKTKQGSVIKQDEPPKKFKPEKIALLKPAFTRNGTVTAGNSSSISDGASALLLASGDWVRKHNARPIAKIIGEAMHAHEPEWFTTAPVGAVQKLLKKVNWTIDQVDLFEINEAFAVVVLAAMKELGIPRDKVNVFGGACALGHPIGSSGSRILVTLIHALRRKNVKRGIATLCIGGGEALAVAVEIVSNPVELSKL